jgi:tRNA 5-methylaminomethyl-2-thiouridine biosynthesis bifunctional protein
MVIAAAHATTRFAPASWLPLNAVLGQLSLAPASDGSAALRAAVVWGGYLAPARDGRHVLGATHARGGFDPDVWPHPVTAAGHRRNHARLPSVFRALLPGPGPNTDPGSVGWTGRAAVRCATPDRLPAVGPLVLPDRFITDFDGLRHGPRGRFPLAPVHHPGLFVLAGLGSRGIMTAALSAEILVSQMLGEPWPVERSVALALAPSRFLVRGLRRAASMPNQRG